MSSQVDLSARTLALKGRGSADEHRPRRLIGDRMFREKLGGISRSSLWRLRETDSRCPRPTKVLGQNKTLEADVDAYIDELLLDDRDGP